MRKPQKTTIEQKTLPFSKSDWRNAQVLLLRLLEFMLQFTPEEFAQMEKWRDPDARERAKEKASKAGKARWAKYRAERGSEKDFE